MDTRLLTVCLCALTVTACADRGESDSNNEASVMQEFLGDESNQPSSPFATDGINGQMDFTNDDGDEADSTDTEVNDETVVDSDDTSVDTTNNSDSGVADDADVADTDSSDDVTEDANPVETTTGGRVLLPSDCDLVTDNQGQQYCLSPSAGNRLFALDANSELLWSTTLSAGDNITDVKIIPGDGLYVVRKPAGTNTALLASLDNSGNTRYEAVLSGDIHTVEGGLHQAPYLFLHTANTLGDSSILQLDAETGRQNLIRSFTGQSVNSFQSEQLEDVQLLSIVTNGVTHYLNQEDLSDFTRIFTLDPTNYREKLPAHMSNMRAEYLVDYTSLLRESINLASNAGDETEVACPGAGSINLLPANSFVSDQQFTRAYEFVDCDINGTVATGSLIHTFLELDTLNGRNGSESLSIQNLLISKPADELSETGEATTEDKTLNAMVRNVYVFNGDNVTSERTFEIDQYDHTYAAAPVLSIAGASYTRLIETEQAEIPAGGYRLTETGSMRAINRDGTLSMVVSQPLVYLQSEAPISPLADAPLSGVVEIDASDRSTLVVDAGRGGFNLQNYTLTQRGTEYTIDDTWPITPVSTSLKLLD